MAQDDSNPATTILSNSRGIFANLKQTLPQFLSRKKVGEALEGIISPRTLANLDSANNGPPHIKVGNKILYEKDKFFQWLEDRTQTKKYEEENE